MAVPSGPTAARNTNSVGADTETTVVTSSIVNWPEADAMMKLGTGFGQWESTARMSFAPTNHSGYVRGSNR